MDLSINVGTRRLPVNPYKITGRHSETLNSKIGEIRAKLTLPKGLDLEPGETREDYEVRYKEWAEARNKEQKSKPLSEILTEAKTLDLDTTLGFMYDCVNAIAETFTSQGVDVELLKDLPVYEVNNYVVRVCRFAKVPVELALIEIEGDE